MEAIQVDITNRAELNVVLYSLSGKEVPKWGLMQPQHMVEHLGNVIQCSNGKRAVAQRTTDEEAALAKRYFIYSNMGMPIGLKSPLFSVTPDVFDFPHLDAAKEELNKELDDFEAYFKDHPEAVFIHPRLGKLNHAEWIIFHNKHFTHHFKQFGLL